MVACCRQPPHPSLLLPYTFSCPWLSISSRLAVLLHEVVQHCQDLSLFAQDAPIQKVTDISPQIGSDARVFHLIVMLDMKMVTLDLIALNVGPMNAQLGVSRFEKQGKSA